MVHPDLNAVSVFAKVVELKNFGAAARALGIPRSTASLKIAQLEDRLGARLLERTTRTLRLTDAGHAYHRRVLPALEALEEAERTVDTLQAEPSGRLRITTTVEGGQAIMGPLMAEYLHRYPKVEVQIELLDRQVDLVEEGFDLALRTGPLADSTLIARRLYPIGPLRVYASPAYLHERGKPRRPEDLAQHDCLIMTSQSQAHHWAFRIKRKLVRVPLRARAAANSFIVLRDLAIAGLGIVRLPEHLATSERRAGTLRPLLDAFAPPFGGWYAVYPSSRNLSSKVRALIALLEERFGESAAKG